jgi:hypothetical protein
MGHRETLVLLLLTDELCSDEYFDFEIRLSDIKIKVQMVLRRVIVVQTGLEI